jgi:hypothetical protein
MKTLIIATAAALALLAAGAGVAHADDGDGSIDQTICSQLAIGQSPGQIAGELHQGDPRWTPNRAIPRIYEAMPSCPDD